MATTRDPARKGLQELPPELHLRIIGFLPDQEIPADVAALARTCKATTGPATENLYGCITLNFSIPSSDHESLLRLVQLLHTLLRDDKLFLPLVQKIKLCMDYDSAFDNTALGRNRLDEAELYPELEKPIGIVIKRLDQEMKRSYRSPGIHPNEATRLIMQKSPNLRHIEVWGYGGPDWDLPFPQLKKLESLQVWSQNLLGPSQVADLASIPTLRSLRLPQGWGFEWELATIPQAQFPSLVDLKIGRIEHPPLYLSGLVTMVPRLKSLELVLGWDLAWSRHEDRVPLELTLSGPMSSSDRPQPTLDKTLEVLRITMPSWKDSFSTYDEDTVADIRANICKKWDISLFGSLRFLQKLKVLKIPMVAPVGKIVRLMPGSLEELHLTDDNLLLLQHAITDIIAISHLPSQLGIGGLTNLKTIKLDFCEVDPGACPSCQPVLDMMRDDYKNLGIELEVFRSDPCTRFQPRNW